MKATGNWTLPVVLLCFIGTVTALLYERNEWTQERGTWDAERDSLTTALDTANARTMRSEGRANYIAWQLDSARKNRPTPQQVIDRNLKAMEYAPLNSVRDTLMMQ